MLYCGDSMIVDYPSRDYDQQELGRWQHEVNNFSPIDLYGRGKCKFGNV